MMTSTRVLANIMVAWLISFFVHRFLMFWHGWPSFAEALSGINGVQNDAPSALYVPVIAVYTLVLIVVVVLSVRNQSTSLLVDSERYMSWSAFVVRFAFWTVFLVGIVDAAISALRIENVMVELIGKSLDTKIGLAKYRGLYVHYPLMFLSGVIAWFSRGLSFIWLAFLVVMAEFAIVITRFVFSYEQAYMGDLVRFWYAALFLFASAYTLIEEGHVRVDVLFAGMALRGKAWVNSLGCLLFGIPFCVTILLMGMENRRSSLSSPIINFEISQSGYGMFVKYLMAGFLIVFAVSMMIQFIGYFLRNVAVLLGDERAIQEAQSKAVGGH